MKTEQIIIVPGNPENMVVCITDQRPFRSHCWLRAAMHCFRFKEFPFDVQLEAAAVCTRVAQAFPPKPYKNPVKWGYGKGWPGQ